MSISSLHIKADGIIEKRRDILESAMQSALLLKNIKLVKILSQQKKSKLAEFKKNLEELSTLISKFKLDDIKEIKPKQSAPKVTVPKQKIEAPREIERPQEKTKIEKELDDIQDKLRKLNF